VVGRPGRPAVRVVVVFARFDVVFVGVRVFIAEVCRRTTTTHDDDADRIQSNPIQSNPNRSHAVYTPKPYLNPKP
jgi:hypothetical protein